ncbi:hypothetical protein EYF80_007940 [Liparis tanakae]|uniref:Uncharacterized protein n=1 Tax=Liparis tanakae TaxID=230148 RepID=A0A4Z2IVG0_9TELE|nr:hypothetical protein EYF80_007940 [Liparis tanakae]
MNVLCRVERPERDVSALHRQARPKRADFNNVNHVITISPTWRSFLLQRLHRHRGLHPIGNDKTEEEEEEEPGDK